MLSPTSAQADRADHAYRTIRKRLTSLRNGIVGVELASFLLRLLGWGAGLLLLNVLLTYWIEGALLRRVLALFSLGLFLLLLAVQAGFLLRRWPTLSWIAGEAERATPDLRGDLLRGALDLWRRRKEGRFGYSIALMEALVVEALQKSEAIRSRKVVSLRRLRRDLPLLPAALGAGLLLLLAMPDRTVWVVRAVGPPDPAGLLKEVGLTVTPGAVTILAGETVPVKALFTDYAGGEARLLVRRGAAEWGAFPMGERSTREGRLFEGEIPPLSENAEYRVAFSGGESPVYRVTVEHPPALSRIAYSIRYPTYTGRDEERVEENHGNVRALFGSRVFLECLTNKPVTEAFLDRDTLDPIPLVADETGVTGSFVVDRSFSYTVRLIDGQGNENEDPVRYEVAPLADENPFVRVSYPGEDISLREETSLPIRFSALDDYGVTEVNLVYRKGEEEARVKNLFSTSHRITEVERERVWDLDEEGLFPEDVISYHLEAWDNDSLRGPKKGVSRTFHIRMPSLMEVFAEVTDDQDAEIEELENLYEESQSIEEKLDELSREIQDAEEVSWEEKQKIEGILDRQKEIEETLREVSKEIEESAEKLEGSQLVTPETIERMMELTRLLNEVATDEMREALQELQKAMEKLDQEEIRKAAENLELTQQDFLERLDRTIEMLKRMKDLQDMDALTEGLQRLAEQQRDVRERTEDEEGGDAGELSREEEALQKELSRIQQEMKELAEETSERSASFSEMLKESLREMESRGTESKMEEAAQSLQQEQRSKAAKAQKKAEDDLFDLAFRLREFVQSSCSSAQQKAQAAFGESIQDLLYLSDGQERLLDAPAGGRSVSVEERRRLAERQLEVAAGVALVMEKIREVGRDVPQVSSMVLDMLRRGRMKADQAAREFEGGDLSLGKVRAEESMGHLNRSVVELLRSQESHSSACQNPQGQNNGMNQLQKMTDQQRGLNQQTEQLSLPSWNPSDLSMEQRAELGRLAAEQQQVRKGIEQLQEEVDGTGEILGRLDDVMEEMRQVERDLEEANLSDETREKQERILSRMLDAQRSLRERGYRRERRSRAGEEYELRQAAPLPRTISEAEEQMREDQLRMPGFVYPPEYEELIRSYFRALSERKE